MSIENFRNKVIEGDCLEVMKGIPDNSIDSIVTDPPYKIITGGRGSSKGEPKGILAGNKKLMRTIPDFEDWLPEAFRVLKPDTQAYFMVNFTNLLKLGNAIEKSGFKIHNLLVWNKNNCTPSQFYMKNCEYTFFCRKGKSKYINNIGGSKTVHQFNNPTNKLHPTEKPVDLMSFYIENSSVKGDIILDPFAGSGTTGEACIYTGRDYILIEKEKEYVDIINERLEIL